MGEVVEVCFFGSVSNAANGFGLACVDACEIGLTGFAVVGLSLSKSLKTGACDSVAATDGLAGVGFTSRSANGFASPTGGGDIGLVAGLGLSFNISRFATGVAAEPVAMNGRAVSCVSVINCDAVSVSVAAECSTVLLTCWMRFNSGVAFSWAVG